ncbi:MAG: zinc-ribbon domain-containing protein [Candidatus Lokiarchaeota archaeon]|nr:zinc-ribbon domain-containing protein [Candidatus Lokiarchaeota archaeon]
MSKFCPYCGNPVRESDKYCIICGKPLIVDLPKKKKQKAEEKLKKDIEEAKEEPKTIENKKNQKKEEILEEDVSEEEIGEEEKEEKKEGKNGKKGEIKEVKKLPEEVKHQIELYAEFSDIQFHKKTLSEKLKDISLMMKDENYELDYVYKEKVNLKFKALKTLIQELKEREKEIENQMDDVFIIQKLNNKIEAKTYQLKNLTREYRLKKVDSDTFENLKNRYKKEKDEQEQNRTELREGMRIWIGELKIEKTDIIGNLKLNKGQFSSKEIDKEIYEKTKKDLEFKLKKNNAKITTLEKLTK